MTVRVSSVWHKCDRQTDRQTWGCTWCVPTAMLHVFLMNQAGRMSLQGETLQDIATMYGQEDFATWLTSLQGHV